MFKAFSAIAALALPAQAIQETLAESQCHAVVVADTLTTFNLMGIEKTGGDYQDTEGNYVLTWNYCTFVDGTQAYAVLSDGTDTFDVATSIIEPTNA